ncbi:MAG: TIGR00304 family protein [Candidatus Aenigmatarchaeota archaeon]
MNERLFFIGILLILIGSFIVFIASILNSKNVKFAFGGFIGFIPFGFANDSQMLFMLIILMLFILMFLLIVIKW